MLLARRCIGQTAYDTVLSRYVCFCVVTRTMSLPWNAAGTRTLRTAPDPGTWPVLEALESGLARMTLIFFYGFRIFPNFPIPPFL